MVETAENISQCPGGLIFITWDRVIPHSCTILVSHSDDLHVSPGNIHGRAYRVNNTPIFCPPGRTQHAAQSLITQSTYNTNVFQGVRPAFCVSDDVVGFGTVGVAWIGVVEGCLAERALG